MSVDLIKQFEISGSCLDVFPCSHSTKTTLLDGREVKDGFDNPDIHYLIQAIAADKIVYPGGKDAAAAHFAIYGDADRMARMGRMIEQPDVMLERVFANSAGASAKTPSEGDLAGKKVSLWTQMKNFCHEHRKAIGIALLVLGAALLVFGLAWMTMGLALLPLITSSGPVFAVTSWAHVIVGSSCMAVGSGTVAGGILSVLPAARTNSQV